MKTDNLTIKWQYVNKLPFGQLTECELIVNDNGVYKGYALCSPSDNFCRDTGRKISLGRAMNKATMPKPERTKVWEAYRNMRPNKRW